MILWNIWDLVSYNIKKCQTLKAFEFIIGGGIVRMLMHSVSWASRVQMYIQKLDFNEEKLK